MKRPWTFRQRISLGFALTVALTVLIVACAFYAIHLMSAANYEMSEVVSSRIYQDEALGSEVHSWLSRSLEVSDRVRSISYLIGVAAVALVLVISIGFTKALCRLYQERELTLDELKRSESRFRSLVESNMVGVIYTDFRGKVYEANDEYLRMLKYTREDMARGELDWAKLTPPDYRERDQNAIREIQAGGACRPFEKEMVCKDGERVRVLVGAARLNDPPYECVGYIADLTELWKAEKERELATRAREQLLAFVAHDLKNPLSAILSITDILSKRLTPWESESGKICLKAADSLRRSALQMSRLISDVLDSSRIEAGSLMLNMRQEEVGSVIREALESIQPNADQRAVRIESELDQERRLEIPCDRDRMLQVLSNLLGNAIKFSPWGGTVRVRLDSTDQEIRVAIEDQGPGIDEDQRKMLFEKYWQARQTAHLGSGMGLSIAKGIVEAHGGRIWVQSSTEKGSVFWFALPKKTSFPAKLQIASSRVPELVRAL